MAAKHEAEERALEAELAQEAARLEQEFAQQQGGGGGGGVGGDGAAWDAAQESLIEEYSREIGVMQDSIQSKREQNENSLQARLEAKRRAAAARSLQALELQQRNSAELQSLDSQLTEDGAAIEREADEARIAQLEQKLLQAAAAEEEGDADSGLAQRAREELEAARAEAEARGASQAAKLEERLRKRREALRAKHGAEAERAAEAAQAEAGAEEAAIQADSEAEAGAESARLAAEIAMLDEGAQARAAAIAADGDLDAAEKQRLLREQKLETESR